MSEMIERVARELAFEHVRSEQFWCEWVPAARAAIEVMREPTAEMCEASLKQDYAEADKFGSYAGPVERWKAMIDEALKESALEHHHSTAGE